MTKNPPLVEKKDYGELSLEKQMMIDIKNNERKELDKKFGSLYNKIQELRSRLFLPTG